jgi:ryanodine receptor 2
VFTFDLFFALLTSNQPTFDLRFYFKSNDHLSGFSMNGELLMDSMGGEVAFTDVTGEGFVPACTLGVGQKAKLVFGQDVNALKFFTLCGLQEGYEPFCV